MKPCHWTIISILLPPLLLCACKSMTPDTAKRAWCNTLKSDIVFNSATSVTREANIQATEAPLQHRTYRASDCEPYSSITPQSVP